MIVKALMAWAGLRAVPHFHDDRVRDAADADAVAMACARRVARQSLTISRDMTDDPADTGRINKGIADMRILMTEVARRADR